MPEELENATGYIINILLKKLSCACWTTQKRNIFSPPIVHVIQFNTIQYNSIQLITTITNMSSLAINIVPDDKVSIVAGPFTGNPITAMNICWAMPVTKTANNDNNNNNNNRNDKTNNNDMKDIDGAVIIGHANGAANIYSENASILSQEEERKLMLQQQDSDDKNIIIKWKKQRMQPHRVWLRRKITTKLDEAIVGIECDCTNCYLVVGIKRALEINVSDRRKVKQTSFRFGKKVYGPKRRHSTFGHICNKKIVCIQCQGSSYFIDYQNNTEGLISTSKINIVPEAYISDFDGNKILVVEKDDESMEFRIHVEYVFEKDDEEEDTTNDNNNNNNNDNTNTTTTTADTDDNNKDDEENDDDDNDDDESEDEFENVVLEYNLTREPWGFKLVSTNAFSTIESDRIITLFHSKTLEQLYEPLKLDSRIVTFTVIKNNNPKKHMLLFICRDHTLKLYLNGKIVMSNLLPSNTIHSFAMSLPYLCVCDISVHGKFFYNDDNYLYQYGIPDEMLKILTTD